MALRGRCFFILFLFPFIISANEKEKALQAERITQAPKIDGLLDDEAWSIEENINYFYEYEPNNGKRSEFRNSIQIRYTDDALYIGARLYDSNPNKIRKELGIRDDDGRNTDLFGFSIDTYKNGQNAFTFLVTAAGVQVDYFISNDNYDYNWDAVWKSAVTIDEEGWIVEMEIPFYAIRFPKKEIQNWGLNFYRRVQRTRQEFFWNYVDNSIRGLVNQYGVLQGIHNVEPPLRLSFLPYITTVYENNGVTNDSQLTLTGGMDLKYGINESFTLDLSLIPDFSQVRSDDQVLNLSPFEVRFSENRPFFTENTDIFDRSGLFYSRRVGQSQGLLFSPDEPDTIKSLPGNAPLINAIKVSGRTKKGTGLGIFNGVTNRTFAEVVRPDTTSMTIDPETGEKNYNNFINEEKIYDPLTNYNVLVVDQNLKNNSNVGIINTNVARSDGGRDANVTGVDFTINDKTNTYRVSGRGIMNMIFEKYEDTDIGYSYNLSLAKISGTVQYGVSRNVESKNYDINDLGYLQSPNEYNHNAYVSYNIFKPFSIFNNMSHSINANYRMLNEPRAFTYSNINYGGNFNFKNFWNFNYGFNLIPLGEDDYFESRNMMVFHKPWAYNYDLSVSSDSRKPVYLNAWFGEWFRPDWDQNDYWVGLYSRLRVNNRLSFTYEINSYYSGKDIGYVSVSQDQRISNDLEDVGVIFGKRDITNAENYIGLNYTFTNRMGLNMRLRHYWSKVEYMEFYELNNEGNVQDLMYNGYSSEKGEANHNTNFNAFNIDMNFSWQVAPGSFFTVTWKNASLFYTNDTTPNFIENINNVVEEPHNNSLSLRLTYFIDYVTLKNSI